MSTSTHTIEILLVPQELAEDTETRQQQVHEFFSQFNADADLLSYSRDELNERTRPEVAPTSGVGED